MNRRDTLKKLLLTSGGLITLPAWANEWSIGDFTAHHSSYSILEQELLASFADTIIPAGNSIGALSIGVDKYLQKLIDKCFCDRWSLHDVNGHTKSNPDFHGYYSARQTMPWTK